MRTGSKVTEASASPAVAVLTANKEDVKELQERVARLEQASPQKAEDTLLARFEAMEQQIVREEREQKAFAAKVKQEENQGMMQAFKMSKQAQQRSKDKPTENPDRCCLIM